MPELPDIEAYCHALRKRVAGGALAGLRLASPFLLRTVDPPVAAVAGRRVAEIRRLGERIVIGLEGELYFVLHLMIAGRLWWHDVGKAIPGGGRGLAAFDFDRGTLVLTEAGSKKRAALHIVRGAAGLAAHDPGGLEVLDCELNAFAARLRSANHTIKRALTDPHFFSGIGNAYSDEILHAAKLSPVLQTQKMSDAEIAALFAATRATLARWRDTLVAEADAAWPDKVTAFRAGMAAHGRYGRPCPVCAAPIQRIRHASNETNYCARCQTGGKLLSDRALARLLHKDWPKTIDELERLDAARARR